MNLWFSAHFLFAGLVLTSSAPTDEECGPLTRPRAPNVQALMSGKMYFIMGYTDKDVFKSILNRTDSTWVQISKVPDDPKRLNMLESNKLSGMCFTSNFTITIDGIVVMASVPNVSSTFHLLPSCAGCLALNANTTVRNLDQALKLMQIDLETGPDEIKAQSVYLFANQTSLPESDLDHFKKQASCLGFSREPDYQHDPEKAFCLEGEGVHFTI